jgi:hypothetical protein
MTRAHRHLLSLAAGGTAAGLFVLACGARTGLDAPLDAAVFNFDAGEDAEAGFDATFDVDFDASFDTGFDAGVDSFFPVDVIAPIDVHVGADSGLACPDGGLPNAYLLRDDGALYTFDPATLATRLLGTPACAGASSPWTLSVSREGNAYVVFQVPWSIYKVDLTTLICTPTPFVAGQLGLNGYFSIAVSRNAGAEKLFVYGEPGSVDGGYPNTPPILAQSDLATFVLSEVGAVLPEPPLDSYPLDMQGDPLGNLFGLSDDGLLIEIDSATGAAIGKADTGFPGGQDWAVMSYENQVYLFAAGGDGSNVARYDIATQTLDVVGTIPVAVLGASAVPCLRSGVVLPSPP